MIGVRMKAARIKNQMTLEEVAQLTGVTRQTIQKYENEIITNIPSDKIEAIAKALRTTPSYLMGWEDEKGVKMTLPDDMAGVITFPVIGDVAAHLDSMAAIDWNEDTVRVPVEDLRGRPASDFFALRVQGDSMYPHYQDGDIVLVLRQATLNRSGDVGVILYNSEEATLKKVEYVMGEDWMKLIPINPNYPPKMIENEELEKCRVLGIPWMLIRYIEE